MEQISNTLKLVLHDPEFSKLSAVTRYNVATAVQRFDELQKTITKLVVAHKTEFDKSQQSYWLKPNGDGVWLTRQSDRYPECVNQ